ncbi:MAG: methyltetrahydrofolate cobalamin methyltransferase, partial [Gammaproteobacteria bacterium]|nr:methyltetrahydrofolate cobalamin methyltransferase [Gammaproteobacteria bacterium]
LKVNTTCGASNISFGLPNRNGMNSAFLSMAIGAGMTSAIANPMHSEVMTGVNAANVMMGHDPECRHWIKTYREAPASDSGRKRRGNRRRTKST